MWRRDPDFSTGHPDIDQCSKALRAKKRGISSFVHQPAFVKSTHPCPLSLLHRPVSESSFCRLLNADALRSTTPHHTRQHPPQLQPALLDSVPCNCCISRIPAPIVPAFPSRQEPRLLPLSTPRPSSRAATVIGTHPTSPRRPPPSSATPRCSHDTRPHHCLSSPQNGRRGCMVVGGPIVAPPHSRWDHPPRSASSTNRAPRRPPALLPRNTKILPSRYHSGSTHSSFVTAL